jgi:hypothetical protein
MAVCGGLEGKMPKSQGLSQKTNLCHQHELLVSFLAARGKNGLLRQSLFLLPGSIVIHYREVAAKSAAEIHLGFGFLNPFDMVDFFHKAAFSSGRCFWQRSEYKGV